jgi:pimeloyl-ACP methyl ester carboxylesterase/class 3 adenylate cyclase
MGRRYRAAVPAWCSGRIVRQTTTASELAAENNDVSLGRVRYARNGDIRLAYRVWGDGEPALVWVPGWVSNVDLYDDPTSPFSAIAEQLARATRLIVWDKRGTGLSDPVTHPPPLDERMDDLHAVLDAAEVDCAALLGASEGGPLSILFAATFPERVRSLVLYGVTPRTAQELPDFPWGLTPAQADALLDNIDAHWGEGAMAELFFGQNADVPGVRDLWGRYERAGASPAMAKLLVQAYMDVDVRCVLAGVRTPTLVLVRPGDQFVSVEAAAALAAGIPNAQFRTLSPGAHLPVDIVDEVVSEVLEFVCHCPAFTNTERVLTTVFFTDIVSSTEQLSARGDERWRHQLDIHDVLVDTVLAKYGGKRAKHTGDGVFALFDGPTKAARCGLELVPALATRGISIRAGVHVGECERRGDEWSGMAVHVGARIGALAGPGEVLASRTVRDLSAGSGLMFEDLGARQLKGLPEETEIFRVTERIDRRPAAGVQ